MRKTILLMDLELGASSVSLLEDLRHNLYGEGKCRSDALSRKNGKPPQKARKQKTTRVRMLEYLSENLNIPEAIRTEQFWNLPPFRTSGSTMPQWQVSEKMYQRRKGSILGGPIWK
ncbi:hypothetical protein Tco_0750842 [Tanacetum coccineum]|uniref:Uncharacterized protein n=1 Tax=Tanacetum coccineum TaxID=301880 RepID=A0ABQ4Z4Z1_9ASTR